MAFCEMTLKIGRRHGNQRGDKEEGTTCKKPLLWGQRKHFQKNKIINQANEVSSVRRDVPKRNTRLADRYLRS